MHPAFSMIFFTTTAGAGYGLLILLALCRVTGLVPSLSPDQVLAMALTGLVLVSAGLISSTFHLANPKNAWRAFTRFRTSWLSREAVFIVAFYPVTLAWMAAEYYSGGSALAIMLAVLVGALALMTLVCTAMIYASLKTIRQWNTPLTPVNLLLICTLVGGLLLLAILHGQGLIAGSLRVVLWAVLLMALLAKGLWFAWIGKPAGPTINTALGFTRATVRLLDVGHTCGTFLTDEFDYQVARAKLIWLRVIAILLMFVVPAVCLALGAELWSLALAALIAYAGSLVERWLFFAEARHVVNLYHGAQAT